MRKVINLNDTSVYVFSDIHYIGIYTDSNLTNHSPRVYENFIVIRIETDDKREFRFPLCGPNEVERSKELFSMFCDFIHSRETSILRITTKNVGSHTEVESLSYA